MVSLAGEADRMIAAAQGGDGSVLGRLMEAHRNYLLLLARVELGRHLRGRIDASDVVQEVFLDAHRHFAGFRGSREADFVAWLRRILASAIANALRRHLNTQARDARLERSLQETLDHSSECLGRVLSDPRASPSRDAMRLEQAEMVAAALLRLPEDYQQVIVLRHMEALPFRQVAERMQRSVDSVEKLWIRALSNLRKMLTATS